MNDENKNKPILIDGEPVEDVESTPADNPDQPPVDTDGLTDIAQSSEIQLSATWLSSHGWLQVRIRTANFRRRFLWSSTTNSDFQILNSSNQLQTGWTFPINFDGITTGSYQNFSFAIVPPSTASGQFKIRILANSLTLEGGRGYTESDVPSSDVETALFTVVTGGVYIVNISTRNAAYTNGKLQAEFQSQIYSVTGVSASDFAIINASNVEQSGWTFDTVPTTLSPTSWTLISATPPTGAFGTFRIRAKANSFLGPRATTPNSPQGNSDTYPGFAIDTRPAVAVSSSTLPTGTQRTATISGTITFDRSIAASHITASDFTLTGGASIAVSPTTGSQATYNLTITQPTRASGTYTVSLNANAIPDGTSYKQGPASAYSLGTVTYDTRPVIGASWSNISTGTITARTATGTLTFTQSVPATELTTGDFTSSDTNVTITAVSPTSGSQTAYTITFTHPVDRNGRYTISLNQNAIPQSSTTTYLQGPSAAVSTGTITYDTRPTVTVSHFNAPSGTQTGATATFELDFNIDVPATALTTSDFTATNGASVTSISPTSGNEDTYTITVTQPTNSNGTYTVTLKEDAIPNSTSYREGPSADYESTDCTYDTRKVVTITWTEPTGEQTGTTADFTLTLGRSIARTHLSAADFTLSNTAFTVASITPTTGSHTTYTVTVNQPANISGSYTIAINAGAIPISTSYLASPAAAVTSDEVDYDTRARITASWSGVATSEVSTATTTATLTFNHGVPKTELTTSDFSSSNQAVTITGITPTSGTNTAYTITFTHPTARKGFYAISLNADTIPDGTSYLEGPLAAVSTGRIDYDTRPTLAVSHFNAPTGNQTGATVVFSLDFDHDIPATELTTDDFTPTNGATVTSISPTTGSEDTYNITVTQPTHASGTYTVSLNAGAVTEATNYKAGPSAAYESTDCTFDTRKPITVTSFTAPSGEQEGTTSTFTLTFARAVTATEVTTADFTPPSGVTIASVNGQNVSNGLASVYQVIANNPVTQQGTYTLQLNARAVPNGTSYLEGPTAAFTSTEVSYDTRPSVTVTHFNAPTGTQTANTVSFALRFTFAVSANQLQITDFEGSITAAYVTAITPSTGSHTDYTITVQQPIGTSGRYTISLLEDAINAESGHQGGPSGNYASTLCTFDTRPQLNVSSFTVPVGIQRTATSQLVITFNQNIPATQLALSEFTPTNGATVTAISPTTGSSTFFTLTVTNPTRNSGFYTISLAMNAVDGTTTYKQGPPAIVTSNNIAFNTRIIATAAWSSVSFTGGKLQGVLTFSGANITGISATDFEVQDDNDQEASGWTFDPTPNNATDGTGITIRAAAPPNVNGSFKLVLKVGSVRSDGDTADNAPSASVASTEVEVDNRTQLTVTSLTAPTGLQTRPTASFALVFSHAVPANELSAADFPVSLSSVRVTAITPTTGSQSAYTITVTHPRGINSSYTLSVRTNAISGSTTYKRGPIAPFVSASVSFNIQTVVATAAWSNEAFVNGRLQASLTFSGADVDRISPSDFEIVTDTFAATTGWQIENPPSEAQDGVAIVIRAIPPLTASGLFRLRLKANSVRSDAALTNNAPAADVTSASVMVTETISWDLLDTTIDRSLIVEQSDFYDEPRDLTHAAGSQPNMIESSLRVESNVIEVNTKKKSNSLTRLISDKETIGGSITFFPSVEGCIPLMLAMYTQARTLEWNILGGIGQTLPNVVTVVNNESLAQTSSRLISNDLSSFENPARIVCTLTNPTLNADVSAIQIWGTDNWGNQASESVVYNTNNLTQAQTTETYFRTITHVYAAKANSHFNPQIGGNRERGWTTGTFSLTAQDKAVEVTAKAQDRKDIRYWTIEQTKGGRAFTYRGIIANGISFSINASGFRTDTVTFLGKKGIPHENIAGDKVIRTPTSVTYPTPTDISGLTYSTFNEGFTGEESFLEIDGIPHPMVSCSFNLEKGLVDNTRKSRSKYNTAPPIATGPRSCTMNVTVRSYVGDTYWESFTNGTILENVKLINRYNVPGSFPSEMSWEFPQAKIANSPDPVISGDGPIIITLNLVAFDETFGKPNDYQIVAKIPEFVAPRSI